MDDSLYIAVDLGAGSGRVFLAGVGEDELLVHEVRRFESPPRHAAGHLRWDLSEIFRQVREGLREAGEIARDLGRPVRSIGVDSWGVDYGLVDGEGALLEDPVCYRDDRTRGVMERIIAAVPRDEIFARTGTQFHEINTLFQLVAHARSGIPERAARMLLIPDLIGFLLTGRAVAEYTNATTTQLVGVRSSDWDRELAERLGLPSHLLPEIVPAGTDLGPLRAPLVESVRLGGVRVVATATHDTASAVAGTPLGDGWAYVSSGTWSLVGVERGSALVTPEVARANFTNEGGAFGTVRFLKNVMGLWILEACRREWKALGLDVAYDRLLEPTDTNAGSPGAIFPDDSRFLNPPSMLAAIGEQLAEQGARMPADPPAVAKLILDSLALRYASVLVTVARLTGRPVAGVHIVGGGSRNDYLNQAAADAAGVPVTAGPTEATVIGNVLVQAIAAGRFASLADARAHVRENLDRVVYNPRRSPDRGDRARRYAAIEGRYLN
jgi:rhamnulokinase